MRSVLVTLAFATLGVAVAGCAGRYRVRAATSTAAVGPDPQLVYVRPGVWAVADYPDSVFYADGTYWRYDGGSWYRSSYLGGGWVDVGPRVVPRAVLRIDRPRRYRRYHPGPRARVRVAPRVRARARGRVQRPRVRARSPRVRARSPRVRTRVRARGPRVRGQGRARGQGRVRARGRGDARRGRRGRGRSRGRVRVRARP